jgi:hypothetical protein
MFKGRPKMRFLTAVQQGEEGSPATRRAERAYQGVTIIAVLVLLSTLC